MVELIGHRLTIGLISRLFGSSLDGAKQENVTMTQIPEQRDVQNQLINYLKGIGWTFIGRYDLPHWRGQDEYQPFLIDVLREQVARLNHWPASDERISEVVRRLRVLTPTIAGNKAFLQNMTAI